jgi:hypothetical protein
MTTEAQITANRSNAEKSTGPRTPEGKEKASQNSLKHGLFAREGVIRGEDWEEFEMHREMLLEELAPNGPLEGMLAARVVDLTWRLQRAGQNQNEVFGALYDRYLARQAAGPGGAGLRGVGLRGVGVPPARVEGVPPSNRESEGFKTRGQDARDTDTARGQSLPATPSGDASDTITPAERGRLLGRMILEDFEHEAVLERLQRYERRIESSFYRTLKELRRVHDQRCKAEPDVAETLARWREEDWQARKAGMFACRPPVNVAPGPAGGMTNTPGPEVAYPSKIPAVPFTHPVADAPAEDQMYKTNPISEGVSSWQCEASSETCKTNPIRGDATWDEAGGAGDVGQTCKTNPISPDPEEGLAAWGEEIRSGSNPCDRT